MPQKHNDSENAGLVASVQKAMNILNCFSTTQPQLSLAQISSLLAYPKSTTLNLIRTLEHSGYLLKDQKTQNYSLGYKILNLSYLLRTSLPVVQYAMPLLEDLQQKTGEIVYLVSHLDGQVLYLEGLYPSQRMVNYSISGKILPMHCTSCGKSMLAYLPREKQDEIIKRWGLPRRTPNTITTKEELLKELEAIQVRGYAIDLEEETPNVKCISVPILNSEGIAVAAISISGTVMNMKDDLLPGYAEMLSRTCAVLSNQAHEFPASKVSIYCQR